MGAQGPRCPRGVSGVSATTGVVLDASAVLALLQEEQGADEVEGLLDGASMSCVNLSEVIQKAEQHGVETEGLEYDLEALGIEFRDFDLSMTRPTAELWSAGSGLSLGDRSCLALAETTDAIAVTTDGRWAEAGFPIDVRVIR
jgi:ribonuclease VapC